MRKALAAVVMAGVVAAPLAAFAASPDQWMVRVRALKMNPANESDAIPSLGVPADAIHVDDKVFPEVDISYFFNSNLALELILTYPQKHDVTLSGAKIGSVKHLPPTLTVQWHFHPTPTVTPYIGAGLNYTRFSSVSLNAGPGLDLDLEKSSTGFAYQLGLDLEVGKNRFINFDWKKVNIESDVILKSNGSKVSHINIDPDLFSIGYGWKF
jgi:outer membrane protein